MPRQIYVNLPVRDLPRARQFFESLGFSFEPKFSNDQGAGMVVASDIYVMLLTEEFFRTFTSKGICDTTRNTEVLTCLSCNSRAEVDELVQKAIAAGGKSPRAPQDHGFMYAHGFEYLDAHTWELVYMDPNAQMPTQS